MDCQICCEKLNKSTRLPVKCNYCEFTNCRSCFQRYLLDSNIDAHCMNCKKIFTRDFLTDNCTNLFITKNLKTHRENILLDREKSLLPATQPYVVLEKERRRIDAQLSQLYRDQENLRILMREKTNQVNHLYAHRRNLRLENTESGEARKFIRKCPLTDCRGFLSNRWKCGVCEKNICNKCNEVKDTFHIQCDPDKVKTMELINKDTKPCPKCGTMIFKIDGCFGRDTEILMWDSSIKMIQDIVIGDELVGDDGTKRIVQDLTTGIDKMYEVQQSNGMNFVVNSKHTLLLKPVSNNIITVSNNKPKVLWFDHTIYKYRSKLFETFYEAESFSKKLNIPDTLKILVDDYIKLPENIKSKLLGFKGDSIKWEKQEVNMDPYLLGLWLGDGYSNGSGFASNDNEIIKYFIEWSNKNNLNVIHNAPYRFGITCFSTSRKPVGYEENCPACIKKESSICKILNENKMNTSNIKINKFKTLLNENNLINNKHIPDNFLRNNRENRLKLLAGIIDTDGHVSNKGKRISIRQVNPILSEQIILLARSLGFIVNYQIVKRQNVKLPNNIIKDCNDQYVINISGIHVNEIPTILPRKKCISSSPNKNYNHTSIKVVPVGSGEYFGFLLDNNHNFILKDQTVQKNCDQMWCPDCQTAFSWNRGTIETGIVHNPHYYEFQRRNGTVPRNPGDIPCGGIPNYHTINVIMQNLDYNHANLTNIHQTIVHIQHVEIRRYTPNENRELINRDLRVKYLLQEIDEPTLKTILQQHEKSRQKMIDYRNICQMFCDVGSDIFRQIVNEYTLVTNLAVYRSYNMVSEHKVRLCKYLDDQFTILEGLVSYFNENIKKVGKIYKCVYPGISSNYRWIQNYESYLRKNA